MTFTLDRDTAVGQVRVLMPGESDDATNVFEDEDITVMLGVNDGAVLLAAAQGLERIAADQVLLLKKVKVASIQVDGPAVSDALLRLAMSYRHTYENGGADADSDFLIASMNVNRWTHEAIVWNDVLRSL